MPSDEEMLEQTLDHLLGNAFAMKAFMIGVTVFLARSQGDPEQWARQLITSLHASVDANERGIGDDATREPFHEGARAAFDEVGRAILRQLAEHPR